MYRIFSFPLPPFFAAEAQSVLSRTRQIRGEMLALRKIQTNRTLFEILFAKTVRAKENRIKSNFVLKKGLTKVNIYNSEMALVRGRRWKRRFFLPGPVMAFLSAYCRSRT